MQVDRATFEENSSLLRSNHVLWITDNQNVAKNGFYDTLSMVPKKKVIIFIIFAKRDLNIFVVGNH